MKTKIIDERFTKLADAACDKSRVSGLTHNFYRYPARFSPTFASVAIELFSRHGDLVLDPYMGGGTTVVEAMASGRRIVGTDLNSLAVFVTKVKTTPLAGKEFDEINNWLNTILPTISYRSQFDNSLFDDKQKLKNLHLYQARFIKKIIACLLSSLNECHSRQSKDFVKCAILKTAQWALDGRKTFVSIIEFKEKLKQNTEEMLTQISASQKKLYEHEFATSQKTIAEIDASNIQQMPLFSKQGSKVSLVVTSPPYPGVHVLYHRWQVDGRRETPAPYWIAGCNDGHGASYYNFADRHRGADDRYFEVSLKTLKAVREVMADGGVMVQMIAFSRPTVQLVKYLQNMVQAGFREIDLNRRRIWRDVPNRRWHAACKGRTNSANEVVLIHQAD